MGSMPPERGACEHRVGIVDRHEVRSQCPLPELEVSPALRIPVSGLGLSRQRTCSFRP